jgi:hypothetical protein
MTKEKLHSVFQFYLDILTTESKRRARFPSGQPHSEPARFSEYESKQHFILPAKNGLAHFRFMCIEAQKFIDEDRVEKAMRWLGFLQGALWALGFYSLDELKNHSRP